MNNFSPQEAEKKMWIFSGGRKNLLNLYFIFPFSSIFGVVFVKW